MPDSEQPPLTAGQDAKPFSAAERHKQTVSYLTGGVAPSGSCKTVCAPKNPPLRVAGTAVSARPRPPQWHCSRCAQVLPPEAVVNGNAEVIAAELLCSACVRKAQASKVSRQWARVALIGSPLLLLAALAFFPSQVACLALLPAGCALLAGVTDSTLSGKLRLVLAASGSLTFGVCLFMCFSAAQPAAAKSAEAKLAGEISAAALRLAEGDVFHVEKALQTLEAKQAEAHPPFSPELKAQLASLSAQVEAWYTKNYGPELGASGRELLSHLFASYGTSTSSGALKFSYCRRDERAIELGYVAAAIDASEAGESAGRALGDEAPWLEALALLNFLFSQYPQTESIELRLAVAGQVPTQLGIFSIPREQAALLRGSAGRKDLLPFQITPGEAP